MSVSPSAPPPAPPCPRAEEGRAWQWCGPATLAAVREASAGARAYLAKLGVPEDDLGAWELVLTEAGNNVALHSTKNDPSQTLEIDLLLFPDRILAHVSDHTPGFDWPDHVSLPDASAESGRGLFILETLTTFLDYQRGRHRNTLVLERTCALPAPPPTSGDVAELEATLDAMTEELGACYESLSAIFRFTGEARQSVSLTDFSDRLLRHLATVTTSDCALLRVVSTGRLTTLSTHGSAPLDPPPLEAAALATRQDQWIEPGPGLVPRSGLVHPFYHQDELMGVLSLERHQSQQPLNAGEVNIVHTFAEFFCQQVLSQHHAEAAIQASVAHREIELAAQIQRSLLPRRLPAIPGLTLAGHCESALSVGGDFYDVMPWGDHGFFFVVADVMGKGVGASMMAAVTRSVFRSLGKLHASPALAMESAARLLYDDLDNLEMFVTVAIGVIDQERGEVRLANAGHCPVIVAYPSGTTAGADPSIPPLGILQSPVCEETILPFPPGSRLLAYSDGLIDPRDLRSPFASPEEVSLWLGRSTRQAPSASHLMAALLEQIGSIPARSPTSEQADDQTFLIIARDSPTLHPD